MTYSVNKTDEQWREELTPEQYAVLREGATEAPFTGRYVDAKEPGVYRCAGCGAELFRSETKYDSRSGWPSFTEPALREQLDVTTIILNNQSYAILNMELARVGAGDPGPAALSMLDLTNPVTDFCAVAKGFGIPAERATDAEGFTAALERALAVPGPALVEAVLPSTL